MSFIKFNQPRRQEKKRRIKRNAAQYSKGYYEWSRRKPVYVKVKASPVLPTLATVPQPVISPKNTLSQQQQQQQQQRYPQPMYTNSRWTYFYRPTPELKVAYEWVNTEGCLIGIREIYVIV